MLNAEVKCKVIEDLVVFFSCSTLKYAARVSKHVNGRYISPIRVQIKHHHDSQLQINSLYALHAMKRSNTKSLKMVVLLLFHCLIEVYDMSPIRV